MPKLQTLFATPAAEQLTADQYIDSPMSIQKSDLIEGVLVMPSPASFQHEDLVAFLIATMRNFVEAKSLGKILSSNAAYRLSAENVFQPDVSFIAADRLHLIQEILFPGPPDIAVEIVSPGSRKLDTVEKKINYGRFGVSEYWLIDPTELQATFYVNQDGKFASIPSAAGIYRSNVLDRFWLEHKWLFPPEEGVRPSVLEIARQHGIL